MSEGDPLPGILQNELQKLGIDITTESGRSEFRNTMAWASQNRRRCEKAWGAALLIIVGGVLSLAGTFVLKGIDAVYAGLKLGSP